MGEVAIIVGWHTLLTVRSKLAELVPVYPVTVPFILRLYVLKYELSGANTVIEGVPLLNVIRA